MLKSGVCGKYADKNIELEKIVKALKDLKEKVREGYKAELVGVFGSYSRREQKKESDIDILVNFYDGATLFDFVGLSDFLEETLHTKVDVAPVDTIREEIKEQVLQEAFYL